MKDEQMIRKLLLDKAGLHGESGTDWFLRERREHASRRALRALPLLPVNHTELAFQNVRAMVGADTHKTCISRYDNSAYTRIYSSCVLQATALELIVLLNIKPTATRTTTMT